MSLKYSGKRLKMEPNLNRALTPKTAMLGIAHSHDRLNHRRWEQPPKTLETESAGVAPANA
jgi:hypothetical protein